ncbi:DUF2975 domain-containing protein [Cyclobacterium plantarum]|uniref:DUF2975 domain-containing protein n=1 Tax=Cyclobacterium plantarum TaxID=2716263 RepID=A0ABX0HCA1_9BACT|nr:DUF2975 domain-containing protein [Cyclobacterium plantarum]NHE58553.1 DUF2975 domain-containing protein [Cyclobacterium plantarum]
MISKKSVVIKVLEILFSIAFVEFCLEASVILVLFIGSFIVNPEASKQLYLGLNLFDLYSFSKPYYISTVLLLIALTGLKSFIAYLTFSVFSKFQLSKPFNKELTEMLLRISHVSLGTGILSIIASWYCQWISKKGVAIPIDWTGNEILFFAGVIYIIALVFKKGTDLQTEHDLTV